MSCYYAGADRPRMVRGEHQAEGCECSGCLPCAHSHCRVCRLAHSAGTCPECMAEVRENLREIGRMCDALPEEVEHRGVEGEAMMLMGPAADPEARGHLLASIRVGRVPADYLEEADGELHPLFVLGTWDMLVRDVLEHDEGDAVLTVTSAIDYLDRQLSYLGGFEDLPFEDMARDLRACSAHLERVLHDGEQVDRGAPCMDCRVPLVREWGRLETADGWRCPRCKEFRTEAEYRLNVAEDHRKSADWLTAADMIERTKQPDRDDLSRGSLTGWASKGLVAKRTSNGRVVYRVSDVLQRLAARDDDAA